MATYADFSAGRPGAAALKAAGFTGVIRYVGVGSAGKRITSLEYQDYVAHGVDVFLVVESGTQDAWAAGANSRTAGRSNAQTALDDCRALGIPDSVPIAAAADSHASGSQIADAVAYCQGFSDVLGAARTGFYGFSETVAAIRAAGAAHWFWLCGSRPSTADQAWVNFWQDNTQTVTVSGIACDINRTFAPIGVEDDLTPEQDAILRDIREQLCGPGARTTGQYPGWPSEVAGAKVSLTVTDLVRGIDNKTAPQLDAPVSAAVAAANAATAAVKALPTAAPAVTLDPASLDAIRASVVAAVGSLNVALSDADKTAIADATANELAKRLVA